MEKSSALGKFRTGFEMASPKIGLDEAPIDTYTLPVLSNLSARKSSTSLPLQDYQPACLVPIASLCSLEATAYRKLYENFIPLPRLSTYIRRLKLSNNFGGSLHCC